MLQRKKNISTIKRSDIFCSHSIVLDAQRPCALGRLARHLVDRHLEPLYHLSRDLIAPRQIQDADFLGSCWGVRCANGKGDIMR